VIEVDTTAGADRHANVSDGWDVSVRAGTIALRGLRRAAAVTPRPLIDPDRRTPTRGLAFHAREAPTLDGTLASFDLAQPLVLDYEDQYRRGEEPYAGPEDFSALAGVSWDDDALYVGLEVTKAELLVRPDGAELLRLDNEPDDIHADGAQIYVRPEPDGPVYGFLVVPASDDGRIRVRGIGGTSGDPSMVRGAWQPSENGYTLSLAITFPQWHPRPGQEIGFDLLVNRIEPGRERRSGQLVWSGGGGWVYLRGDRQDPESFGVLELR
jgi:hypothetical protein